MKYRNTAAMFGTIKRINDNVASPARECHSRGNDCFSKTLLNFSSRVFIVIYGVALYNITDKIFDQFIY